eukprot:TRINITY_DN42465_c0_g1_i1.p1 TRINITY_DN42465_c0_g1~~TRINITY_DN42465_c0_g1_i1.p1  ORF type:complete len:368 (+),score=29.46 TRINITY_DN42465_c0_g1_i1:33-1106(+)
MTAELLQPDGSDPLIVFVNGKSGGQLGGRILATYRQALGDDNVFDLANGGPSAGLRKCQELIASGKPRPRILVAGGDGTVDWVLGVMIEELGMTGPRCIPIAVLPLGTGNDMARALKWGGRYSAPSPANLIRRVQHARAVPLDRWLISLKSDQGVLKSHVMCNYFSVGNDANVCYNFHTMREQHPSWFKGPRVNQFWYGVGGLKAIPTTRDVRTVCSLRVDGSVVDIPAGLKSLLILNIPSYMGGANLWGERGEASCCCLCVSPDHSGRFTQASASDGRLEIIGMGPAPWQAMVRTCNCTGVRLAQGSDIVITMFEGALRRPFYWQMDGEPFPMDPVVHSLSITHTEGGLMLESPNM